MIAGSTLIFESADQARVFELVSREAPALSLSLDRLLEEIFPEPLPDRAAFAAQEFLPTIEALRAAGILAHDDIDYAFGELPDTPAHRALREAMALYAESPLAEDTASRVTTLIEKLKEGEVTFGGGAKLLFVKALSPSALFVELANAFPLAEGVDEARAVEPWELAEGKARGGVVLRADTAPSLARLADHAVRLVERGFPARDLVVPFGGEPGALNWLRHFFHHKRIPFRSLFPRPGIAKEPPFDALLSAIRRDKSRPLGDRLRLAATLLDDTATRRTDVDWPAYFTRLEAAKKIRDGEAEYLFATMGLLRCARNDGGPEPRHCEGRSPEAIPLCSAAPCGRSPSCNGIASLRSR